MVRNCIIVLIILTNLLHFVPLYAIDSHRDRILESGSIKDAANYVHFTNVDIQKAALRVLANATYEHGMFYFLWMSQLISASC